MKDAQKPDHISLNTLVGRLKEGRFVIPDFQREFEWKPWDIRDLVRSIFLDYYIGSLLLWKGKPENFDALACEPIYAFKGQESPEHIVLDGQQRLTALYYALMAPDAPAPSRANRYLFFIRVDRLMDDSTDEAFLYDWTRAGEKYLKDLNAQFEGHMFPLAVVGRGGWDLFHWIQGYETFWSKRANESDIPQDASTASKHASNAAAFGELVKSITEQYQIAYIELDRDLPLDKVCDIFTQVNSKGVRLDVFDLVNALLKPKGLVLRHMWREAASRLSFVSTERMNIYVLQVMSILRQAYCSPKYLYYLMPGQPKVTREPDGSLSKQILVASAQDFEALWNTAVGALEASIKTLKHPQEYGAIASQYLPYTAMLPAFAALQVAARQLSPDRQLAAQRKIRQWYWASVFNNRYSGSVESTSARDFLDLTAWFQEDDAKPALVAELPTRLKTLPLRHETRRGTSVYNGVFNLLVLRGARDWMSGKVPQYDDLDDHHIVPKDWAKTQPVGGLIDSILNRTPLTSETNRHVISNRLPNKYLPELIKASGESSVRAILDTHFIAPEAFDILLRDPFTLSDFEEFVDAREQAIRNGMEAMLLEEKQALPPDLRELDDSVSRIELGLRSLIVSRLNGNASRLPTSVLMKIEDRIQSIASKDAAFDLAAYDSIEAKLQYADLRDLQEAMMAKSLWPEFAPLFANKDTLTVKYDQLANLRNALSHNRSISGVGLKEGEAAIMWFDQVLAKPSEAQPHTAGHGHEVRDSGREAQLR
jgi:hypothetical protein